MFRILIALTVIFVAACKDKADQPSGSLDPQNDPRYHAILPPEDFVPLAPPPFATARDLMQLAEPALIRGRVPDKSKFQAVIWIGNCTATLVGPQMVYTAAHCVGRGGISYTVNGQSYSAECRTAREYHSGNSTADYALCYSEKAVTGIEFETINMDSDYVKVGDKILLSGYGCQRWGSGIDGKYRIGESKAIRVPSGNNNDIVTQDGGTLCSGDSGGPAWKIVDGQREKMVSVNSRSDTTRTSYLSALGTTIGKRFTEAVLQIYPQAEVCGTARSPKNCLNSGEGPGPEDPQPGDNYFYIDHPLATVLSLAKPGKESKVPAIKKGFEQVLDSN